MKRHIALGAVLALTAGILTSSVAGNQAADKVKPEVSLDTAAKAADAYIEPHAEEIHADTEKERYQRVDAQRSHGLTYVSYEREYRGLPVVGGDFVVVTDNSGDVKYSQSSQSTRISVDVEPRISEAKAAKRAETATDGEAVDGPRLVVLAWDKPALAWETVVKAETSEGLPTETFVYTDARSGKVLETSEITRAGTGNTHYNGNGTVSFGTTQSGGSYVMRDPARSGLSCARQGGSPYTDSDDTWGNGSGSDLVTACVDAMYAAGQQADMLSDWLGRDGIDGNGGFYPLYVGLQQQNAYWNGSSATFGYAPGGQLVPLDVVAHELGHGIFQNTPGGSGGGNETGGLNEGSGDIFGALTEWYDNQPDSSGHDAPDYLVGERADFLIRDMANPSSQGHPDCWSTSIPNTEVHAAAGPINHFFYLLAEGTAPGGPGKPGSDTCDGSTLTGIGVEKAGQVYMGALNGKVSSWTYTEARDAALNFAASTDLFPTCAEYDATKAAFDAVSVRQPSGGDPTCSKSSQDFDLSVAPNTGRIDPGGSTTAAVSTTTVAGESQQVNLSATTDESTVTAEVSPSTVTSGGDATLTVSAAADTPNGRYTVTVEGAGETGTKEATYTIQVGEVTGPVEVFTDDFSTDTGWTVDAGGNDTAAAGQWDRGDPAGTSWSGTTLQRSDCASEVTCLVTDPDPGSGPGSYDVDGGTTSVTSPQFTLPGGQSAELTFQGYLAHLNNSSSADYLRISVQTSSGTTTVHSVTGAGSNRSGAWSGYTVDLSAYAGQSIRLVVSAADSSTSSLVEAGVDNVVVTSG